MVEMSHGMLIGGLTYPDQNSGYCGKFPLFMLVFGH